LRSSQKNDIHFMGQKALKDTLFHFDDPDANEGFGKSA